MHGGLCADDSQSFRFLYNGPVRLLNLSLSHPKIYNITLIFRTSPSDLSRKWGVYYVVGLVLKCYFRASSSPSHSLRLRLTPAHLLTVKTNIPIQERSPCSRGEQRPTRALPLPPITSSAFSLPVEKIVEMKGLRHYVPGYL